MEGDRRYGETSNNAKKLKLDEEADNQDEMDVAILADVAEEANIADANNGSTSNILKLDIDCCEELFAFLPLKDLHSLGQTCKKMHQYTGYFVRENYKSTEFQWKNGNLYFYMSKMNGFIEIISNLRIRSDQLEQFAEFAPKFKSLRKLRLNLKNNQIDCIKEILHKCEEIEIYFDCNVLNIDLYEKILKFCTNLKHFSINCYIDYFDRNVLINNNWLLNVYPNLESLDLYSNTKAKPTIAEMRTFFILNTGIRRFRTNFLSFWDCQHFILDTDIKLDELSVVFKFMGYLKQEHINLLNTLYERGSYKHLSLLKIQYHNSTLLAKIRAPLTMEISKIHSSLPQLNLKELRLQDFNIDTKLVSFLANNVSTIESVHFRSLKTESVLFLIRKFIKLREIKIGSLDDVNSLNLATLNEEREKLVGAKSVTIYLDRADFNQVIKIVNLELVKVKCI